VVQSLTPHAEGSCGVSPAGVGHAQPPRDTPERIGPIAGSLLEHRMETDTNGFGRRLQPINTLRESALHGRSGQRVGGRLCRGPSWGTGGQAQYDGKQDQAMTNRTHRAEGLH